jgi:hypothetical protein
VITVDVPAPVDSGDWRGPLWSRLKPENHQGINMNNSYHAPTGFSLTLACIAVLAVAGSTAYAAENDLRIVPQLMVGTAGFEPGLAMEWRGRKHLSFVVRPEVFVNEDGGVGGGGAFLVDMSAQFDLNPRHALAVGPRVVHHNSDQYGWEADALATWSYDLVGADRSWQHAIGVLGAVGVVDDKEHDDYDLGLTAGVFYSFWF